MSVSQNCAAASLAVVSLRVSSFARPVELQNLAEAWSSAGRLLYAAMASSFMTL